MKFRIRSLTFLLIVLTQSCGAGCTDQQLDAWEDFFEALEKM
tara:strand:+ start:348 stop:473 length:126 start_codon:yes stop_codon:yes gene_type:complete